MPTALRSPAAFQVKKLTDSLKVLDLAKMTFPCYLNLFVGARIKKAVALGLEKGGVKIRLLVAAAADGHSCRFKAVRNLT
jgi:hypothetical protein